MTPVCPAERDAGDGETHSCTLGKDHPELSHQCDCGETWP